MPPGTVSPAPPLRRAGRQLAAAWRSGAVKRGFFGTLAIELGSFTPAYLPQASPIWGPLRAAHLDGPAVKVLGTVVVMAGMWLLVDGWFRLRRPSDRPAEPWATLLIWSLPFLFGPPIFSHDAYSYAAQGWLLLHHLDPYSVGPGVLPGPFADLVAAVWRDTPAPYGPLALRLSEALTALSGGYATVAAELQRVPAVVGTALIVTFLPRLAGHVDRPPAGTPASRATPDAPDTPDTPSRPDADTARSRVVWFACLNPLVVIDCVGGAHNDALMMGLVIVALWLAAVGPGRRADPAALARHRAARWLAAAVLVGAAAAIKQPAFLAALVLPLVGGPPPDWRNPRQALAALGRMLAALATSAATFAALSLACGLGFGWLRALGVPGSVATVSPTSLIGETVQWFVNRAPSHAGVIGDRTAVTLVQTIGTALGFALIAVIALTLGRRRPVHALSLSWLAIAFLGPALHSWYVLWGGLLLPLGHRRPATPRIAVGVTVTLLSYAGINLAWRNGLWAVGAAAAALLMWLAVLHERDRRRADKV
ncbi:MAG: polyprenol phosphomannose-dependent alpha 1,6 mannosyltransferase MptB [Propionibacteriaceae bacterium]|nr:polyprenol phosphomannose-dependent alpha 1,6 mannosyltransferase MptB [Propionibacteriaceae bacterium]